MFECYYVRERVLIIERKHLQKESLDISRASQKGKIKKSF